MRAEYISWIEEALNEFKLPIEKKTINGQCYWMLLKDGKVILTCILTKSDDQGCSITVVRGAWLDTLLPFIIRRAILFRPQLEYAIGVVMKDYV